MRLKAIAIASMLLGQVAPLHAAVTSRELGAVEASPHRGAFLPLKLPLQDEGGAVEPLQAWLGAKPSIWVLADYTCKTLCGPVVSIVSDALAHSGLRPGDDFRLVVVGLDPKDTAADADAMKRAQIGDGMVAASSFLRADSETIDVLTHALGFRYLYDRDHDQFAHPAAAFVVMPDGRIVRALAGLALDPATIRLAVIEAARGTIGNWADHIRLLCYGYDPASGTYNVAIGRILAATGATTLAALTLLIGFLIWHRPAARGGTNDRGFARQNRSPTTE